jgi:hypothetical protein
VKNAGTGSATCQTTRCCQLWSRNAWRALAIDGHLYRFCANAEFDVCNWLVDAAADDRYCVCCRHNRTIPDVSIQANLIAWRKIEAAKHRLFYTLLKLRLPLAPADGIGGEKLIFDFLAAGQPGGPKVMTGYEDDSLRWPWTKLTM